jgi:hypothetical protein
MCLTALQAQNPKVETSPRKIILLIKEKLMFLNP